MKFLANENFPGPSIALLQDHGIDILSIAKQFQGISDQQVMRIAIKEERIILTHDSDYGELIFKYGYKPQEGVIYFRMFNFGPSDPAKVLLELINKKTNFKNQLTVIDDRSIRQRTY
jgi:predicted nuclease of predicted toxin-antitoxin system